MPRIIHVEDDGRLAEMISRTLGERPDGASVQLERIATESEFRRELDRIVRSPPDLIIMDVMLRWADPAPDLQRPPEDVQREGYFKAGLRCQKLLAEREPGIRVLLYTVLERSDLKGYLERCPGAVEHLSKEADLEPLLLKIREMLGSRESSGP